MGIGLALTNVFLALVLGWLIAERMIGKQFLLSAAYSRMVYPQAGTQTPYGRSVVFEAWVGGKRP